MVLTEVTEQTFSFLLFWFHLVGTPTDGDVGILDSAVAFPRRPAGAVDERFAGGETFKGKLAEEGKLKVRKKDIRALVRELAGQLCSA